MIFEKKLIISIGIIKCLIEKYDESTKDSATADSEVINYCTNEFNVKITNPEFEETVDWLNNTYTSDEFINKHIFSLVFGERIISTEFRLNYLINTYSKLSVDLDKVSTF